MSEFAAKRVRTALCPFILGVLVFFSLGGVAAAERLQLLATLDGAWSGEGWIEVRGGAREQVRCKVSYRPDGGDNRIAQDLRCASASHRLTATSQLALNGKLVIGTWRESSFDISGSVTGRASIAGMSLRLESDVMQANIQLLVEGCRLAVHIAPDTSEIAAIAVALSKC